MSAPLSTVRLAFTEATPPLSSEAWEARENLLIRALKHAAEHMADGDIDAAQLALRVADRRALDLLQAAEAEPLDAQRARRVVRCKAWQDTVVGLWRLCDRKEEAHG